MSKIRQFFEDEQERIKASLGATHTEPMNYRIGYPLQYRPLPENPWQPATITAVGTAEITVSTGPGHTVRIPLCHHGYSPLIAPPF